MNNLTFDDGFQEVTLNNDPNRVIRWNPTDINFVDRFLAFKTWVDEDYIPKIKSTNIKADDWKQVLEGYTPGTLEELGKELNEAIDTCFNSKISEVAFGGASPLTPIKNGNLLFINFIDALTPMIEESLNKFDSARQRYTNAAKKASGAPAPNKKKK